MIVFPPPEHCGIDCPRGPQIPASPLNPSMAVEYNIEAGSMHLGSSTGGASNKDLDTKPGPCLYSMEHARCKVNEICAAARGCSCMSFLLKIH